MNQPTTAGITAHAWHPRPANPDVLFTPVDLVREIYARLVWPDVPGVLALLSPEVEIAQTTELPWGGRFRGLKEAEIFFTQLHRHTEGAPGSLTYVLAGEDVAVTGRLRGTVRSTGRLFDLDMVHIWRVRQGKATRCAMFVDTPAMKAALAIG